MSSLDLGDLRIALQLDNDQFQRGLVQAKTEMAGLSTSAQREVVKVQSTLGDGGRVGGRAFGDGVGDGIRQSRPKLDASGREASSALSRGMQLGLVRNSPLIAAGVAGALIAGAPAAIAGAGVLFGGIAAVAMKSNDQIVAAATTAGNDIKSTFMLAAERTVPAFTDALKRIGTTAVGLGPQLNQAFGALNQPIDLLTTGLIAMAHNALPGLVSAVQSSGPVFAGLSSLLSEIGTGLGQFFQLISQHGASAGQAFAAIGQIVQELLPTLGQLLGTGADLASQVLPPLAAVLGDVGGALRVVAPLLPAVATGFLAFKAVSALDGPLRMLSARLQTIAADSDGLRLKLAGGAASAVSKIGAALPVAGAAFGVFGLILQQQAQTAQNMAMALGTLYDRIRQGGQAGAQAAADLAKFTAMVKEHDASWTSFGSSWQGWLDKAKAAQQSYMDNLSPLDKAQQEVTRTQNDYLDAVNRWGADSGQAVGASVAYRDAQQQLAGMQTTLKAATDGVSVSAETNTTRLQGLANTASTANTQISLLTGALNALTGKAVTLDQAEIAVTQSVDAVTQAVKSKTAALAFNNGQLDLSNAKSAQAAQMLLTLGANMHQEIGALEQQGATTAQVTAKSDAMRAQFVQVAEQMGANRGEAEQLANRYLGIPKDVHTEITADTGQATSALAQLKTYMDSIRNRTVHVTVIGGYQSVAVGGVGRIGSTIMQAQGGIVHAFAGGGFEPMAGGTAQIVPPNTYRVIGDRIRDDEAYIPINHSARSQSILAQTNARMGDPLGAAAPGPAGSGRVVNDNRVINAYGFTPASLARELEQQQHDKEFLAGVA